ncbi:MAG: TPR end-of-group domain-containing protein [Betaproteobacteria bacterium]
MKTKLARKPARPPVTDRRYQQALDLFERAVKALGRKDFDRAKALLDTLLEEHADQQELLERARAYRARCARPRRLTRPRTFEELLNYGVVLHNQGDFVQAVKYLSQAVELQPRSESALYCLAAAQARAGDTVAALRALRSAINANPASRAQARHDADFEPLRGAVEFRTLVAPNLP